MRAGRLAFVKRRGMDTAERYEVRSLPTLIVFRDGTESARLDGFIRTEDLEAVLNASSS